MLINIKIYEYTLTEWRTTQTIDANSNTVVHYPLDSAKIVSQGPQLYCGSCSSLEVGNVYQKNDLINVSMNVSKRQMR